MLAIALTIHFPDRNNAFQQSDFLHFMQQKNDGVCLHGFRALVLLEMSEQQHR